MKHIEVMRKWCKKIGIDIFDKWLIPLDHVTYTDLFSDDDNINIYMNNIILLIQTHKIFTWIISTIDEQMNFYSNQHL